MGRDIGKTTKERKKKTSECDRHDGGIKQSEESEGNGGHRTPEKEHMTQDLQDEEESGFTDLGEEIPSRENSKYKTLIQKILGWSGDQTVRQRMAGWYWSERC